jgi:3-hydroxybutyrate dehydrogenase
MTLKDKRALVTGSTSGIGLAIARSLVAQGASVMLNGSSSAEKAEPVRAALAAETGAAVFYTSADLSKPDGAFELVGAAEKALGGVDILVNNAGLQFVAPVESFPVDKWNLILALNLSAAFHAMQAAIPGMKARGWGRIINNASAHATVASPFKSAYVAAKHGLLGLTKVAALETAKQGITVNCISPGYVWTPLVEKQIPETMAARGLTREQVMQDVLLAAQPTKQFVTVEQVAALAAFLCSDEAASITGTNLPIDGGWTAQ